MAASIGPAEGNSSGSIAAPLILGIGLAVVGAAAAGVGYWAYLDASARDDQLNQYTTRAELDRLSSQARSKALLADVLFGTALAAGLVSAFWILSRSEGEPLPAPTQASRAPARPPARRSDAPPCARLLQGARVRPARRDVRP